MSERVANGDDDESRWSGAWRYLDAPVRPPVAPRELRQLLHRYGLHARKGLGQNFLVDQATLHGIVSAADLKPDDVVVEVGPGLGILTAELARQVSKVVAVEIDAGLSRALREIVGNLRDVEVVQADILRLDHVALVSDLPYKVVANLPYYITSPTLRHFLEARVRPRLMVVLVQKQVAERITARPGDMSLLAVSVQFYGDPAMVATVPAEAFYPAPKVDSAILRIEVYDRPVADVPIEPFFKVVSAGFSQPRKQLHNAVQQGMWLPPGGAVEALRAAGIDPKRRAETLDVDEWVELCRKMIELGYLKS